MADIELADIEGYKGGALAEHVAHIIDIAHVDILQALDGVDIAHGVEPREGVGGLEVMERRGDDDLMDLLGERPRRCKIGQFAHEGS